MTKLILTAAVTLALTGSFSLSAAQDRPEEDWHVIEADNGARFGIEMNSITHDPSGSASAAIYAIEGTRFNPHNLRRIVFDCTEGYYMDTGIGGRVHYAPPRSVIARLAEIACAGARDRRHEE